jgi:hypothetical protein
MSEETYQYLPADGWYMTFPNAAGAPFPRTFFRVALWRIEKDGSVQGLISTRLSREHAAEPVRLIAPPRAEGGQYVHFNDLAPEDRRHIVELRFA